SLTPGMPRRPNEHAPQPRGLDELHIPEPLHAPAVCCSGGFGRPHVGPDLQVGERNPADRDTPDAATAARTHFPPGSSHSCTSLTSVCAPGPRRVTTTARILPFGENTTRVTPPCFPLPLAVSTANGPAATARVSGSRTTTRASSFVNRWVPMA